MFRYRCPQCSVVLQALEIRAGKTTVCSKCSQPVTIPADKRHWLNEKGEPLLASPTMVISAVETTPPPRPPMPEPEPEPPAEANDDVLGAIEHGDIGPAGPPSIEINPPPEPTPAFSRSLPAPDPDDGKVELYPPSPPSPVAETPRPAPTPPPRRNLTPPPRPTTPPPPVREPAWAGPASRTPNGSGRQAAPAEGAVAIQEPLKLRTGMDLAVDLTAALASRMKPPPKPPRDLKPSTAVWFLTIGLALVLLGLTLGTSNNFANLVMLVGCAQALAGYCWVTLIAFRRDIRRGVLCAIPPITFAFLTNWKYARYRPLRFVVSGLVIAFLGLLAPKMQGQTRAWVGADNPQVVEPPVPITSQPKINQLRYYRDQRQYDALIALLRTLARTDAMYSEEAKNRVDISAELKSLCKHADSGVRMEALAAYATWGGAEAREYCLDASRAQSREERIKALQLLPRWKDDDVARRVAEMIGRAGPETSAAQDALITIGGSIAEKATIPLLRKDDQSVRLTAIEILANERVGGADAIAALKEVIRTSSDPGTRQRAEMQLKVIEERPRK